MRQLCLIGMILLIAGCTVRKPTERSAVARTYDIVERNELIEELTRIMNEEGIQVKSQNIREGTIVSDSFDVLPEFCDCGRNFFGAEYPGQRRGVMKVKISGTRAFKLTFDFHTKLVITANNKQVLCTSFGILEEKLLNALDKSLGVAGKSP